MQPIACNQLHKATKSILIIHIRIFRSCFPQPFSAAVFRSRSILAQALCAFRLCVRVLLAYAQWRGSQNLLPINRLQKIPTQNKGVFFATY